LWSKPLPSGAAFDLDDATPGVYLHHRSDVGEFFLARDSVIPTFTRWAAMQPIVTSYDRSTALLDAGFPQPRPDRPLDLRLTAAATAARTDLAADGARSCR
jgi:hypothetical protein